MCMQSGIKMLIRVGIKVLRNLIFNLNPKVNVFLIRCIFDQADSTPIAEWNAESYYPVIIANCPLDQNAWRIFTKLSAIYKKKVIVLKGQFEVFNISLHAGCAWLVLGNFPNLKGRRLCSLTLKHLPALNHLINPFWSGDAYVCHHWVKYG